MQNTKPEVVDSLIDLVREYPCLYSKNNKDYKNKNVKENAWTQIGMKLQKNGTECQAIWKAVRQQYLQFRRKLDNPTGSAAGKRPFCRYERALDFCRESLQENEHICNVALDEEDSVSLWEPVQNPDSNLIIVRDVPESEIVYETGTQNGIPTVPPQQPPTRLHARYSGKRKDNFDDKLLNILGESKSHDEFDLFCSAMACKLRKMNNKNSLAASELQLRIHELIHLKEVELNE